jgi:para-nitrobenzyl esterase
MLRNLAIILLTGAALSVPVSALGQTAEVTIDSGAVRGEETDGVLSWKGIPFAQPPIGDLRWRAPQPVKPWKGVRKTTEYSHDCMQVPFPSDAAPLGTEPAEDCLYMNVWRPAGEHKKLPVMVWIYGGGFVNGGASPPTYSGANLAKDGIVVVSFNYRLGRFGTFALPQLTAADPDKGLLGNYFMLDQVAALEWVRRNVGAFGGDPANVTIIGESAGGMSVHNLLTSPLSQGLFQRAVVMSGGNGISEDQKSLGEIEELGANLARRYGIDATAPDALAKLRALSAEQVTDGLNLMNRGGDGPPSYSGPFADGKVLVDLDEAYAAGRFSRVPVMVGATSADIGGKSGFMIAGARDVSSLLADKGLPVWNYRFSYVADSIGQPGAQHAAEIPYFFDTVSIKYGDATTAKDIAVGELTSSYLVNFVKTGDPNGPGLTFWPQHTRSGDEIMDFAASGRAAPQRDPWGAEIEDERRRIEAARASGHYNSLVTPLGEMLDNHAARAILAARIPMVINSDQLGAARGMTLSALAGYLPQVLTDKALAEIDAELAELPKAR